MGIATNVELHKLYEAAIAFRKLQPWKWMYASQVFIVHDDERDIDGFCSIMGMMGEHFSLSVYLGESGYQSYRYLYDKDSLAYIDHIFMKAEVKKNCFLQFWCFSIKISIHKCSCPSFFFGISS